MTHQDNKRHVDTGGLTMAVDWWEQTPLNS